MLDVQRVSHGYARHWNESTLLSESIPRDDNAWSSMIFSASVKWKPCNTQARRLKAILSRIAFCIISLLLLSAIASAPISRQPRSRAMETQAMSYRRIEIETHAVSCPSIEVESIPQDLTAHMHIFASPDGS